MFSDKTQEILLAAGWSTNYHYDASEYFRIFEGCAIPEKVLSFLQDFGGLKLFYPHRITKETIEMSLNPREGLTTLNGDICNDLEHLALRIGSDFLFFIGRFENGYMEMMMDENGIVYGAYDEFLVKVAESGIEAIEAICSGKEFVEID